jgi:epoxyqueuosine reductase
VSADATSPAAVTAALLELTRAAGFHRAAIVPIAAPRRLELYTDWLAAGRHGEMAYLADAQHVGGRGDLRALLPEARTLVVVALAYDRARPAPPPAPDGLVALRGRVARYAAGDDYHMVVRDLLAGVADQLAARLGRPVAARPCVDTAAVLERDHAERGGLGFVAKNTMLIAPGLGSYVVLGELLLDVDAAPTAPDEPPRPRCGGCRACLDACPTGAFVDAYVLDARRCISYLTIELDGAIPRELRRAVGAWIFGCDVCQEVCPFNAADGPERATLPARLVARDAEHALPDLVRLAGLGANQLRQFVKRTALRRAPADQLRRNVAVALGNSGDARAVPALVGLLASPAALVRGHAAWGLGELARALPDHAAEIDAALAGALAREVDAATRDELTAARAATATVPAPAPPRAP